MGPWAPRQVRKGCLSCAWSSIMWLVNIDLPYDINPFTCLQLTNTSSMTLLCHSFPKEVKLVKNVIVHELRSADNKMYLSSTWQNIKVLEPLKITKCLELTSPWTLLLWECIPQKIISNFSIMNGGVVVFQFRWGGFVEFFLKYFTQLLTFLY